MSKGNKKILENSGSPKKQMKSREGTPKKSLKSREGTPKKSVRSRTGTPTLEAETANGIATTEVSETKTEQMEVDSSKIIARFSFAERGEVLGKGNPENIC